MPPSQPILSSRLPGFICRSCLSNLQKTQRPQAPWLSRNIRTTPRGPRRRPNLPPVDKTKTAPSLQSRERDSDPVVRHFQQTPDGTRIEVSDEDPATDDEFKAIVGSIIGNLDRDLEQAAEYYGITKEEYEEKLGISKPHMERHFGIKSDANPWEKQDVPDEEEVGEDHITDWNITEEDIKEELQVRKFEKRPLPLEIFGSDEELTEERVKATMSDDERLHDSKMERLVSQMQSHMNAFTDLAKLTEEERIELRRRLLADAEADENEDVREYPDDIIVEPDDPILSQDIEDDDLRVPKEPLTQRELGYLPRLKEIFEREPDPEEAQEVFESLQNSPGQPQSISALSNIKQRDRTGSTSKSSDYAVPINAFPSEYKSKLTALNMSLLSANKNPTLIWQKYTMCRPAFRKYPQEVPNEVWHLLWHIFATPGPNRRMERIFRLGMDMHDVGISLQGHQRIWFIESILDSGQSDLALQEWQKSKNTLSTNTLTARDFWEVGTKIYTHRGQPDLAVQVLDVSLFRSKNLDDQRLLIHVMRSYLNSGGPAGVKKSWAVYRILKYRLGESMTMQDYDVISKMFLDAKRTDYGIRVFADMMLRAELNRKSDNKSVVDDSLELAENIKISALHSQTLENLPKRYDNKFFYGKWIKKLIGDGNLSGANRVLDYMRDRSICPDARHVNGLIGAWYRKGTSKYQKLADATAWRMITARVRFVLQRDGEDPLGEDFAPNIRKVESTNLEDYRSTHLDPLATMETFSILVEQYRNMGRLEHLDKLMDALKVAKVRPSTFFMNEMIRVRTLTTRRDASVAWEDYLLLTETYKVLPDFDTFGTLWYLQKKAKDPVTGSAHGGFVGCRRLFRQMVDYSVHLTQKETMPRELYDSIILAFALDDDQPGLAVAIKAMQKHFNIDPGEQTARSIILHLTRANLKNKAGYRPRRLNLKPAIQGRIIQMAEVLASFKRLRDEELLAEGIVFDELDTDTKIKEGADLMMKLLRHVCQARMDGNPKAYKYISVNEGSRIAAKNMGVPDCDPWV